MGPSPFPTITFNDERRAARQTDGVCCIFAAYRSAGRRGKGEEEVIEMYDDTAQERVGSKAGCSNTSIFRHLKAGLLLTILSHCHDCELLNAMRINYFLHFITSVQLLHSTCEYDSVGKGDLRGRRLQARKGKGEGSRKFGAEGSKVRKVIRHRDKEGERECRLGRPKRWITSREETGRDWASHSV